MPSSDESTQAFDKFRDENPGWHEMSPYAVARLFWNAASVDHESQAGSSTVGHTGGAYVTLGHVAAELRRMKQDGITRESIAYALGRVYVA